MGRKKSKTKIKWALIKCMPEGNHHVIKSKLLSKMQGNFYSFKLKGCKRPVMVERMAFNFDKEILKRIAENQNKNVPIIPTKRVQAPITKNISLNSTIVSKSYLEDSNQSLRASSSEDSSVDSIPAVSEDQSALKSTHKENNGDDVKVVNEVEGLPPVKPLKRKLSYGDEADNSCPASDKSQKINTSSPLVLRQALASTNKDRDRVDCSSPALDELQKMETSSPIVCPPKLSSTKADDEINNSTQAPDESKTLGASSSIASPQTLPVANAGIRSKPALKKMVALEGNAMFPFKSGQVVRRSDEDVTLKMALYETNNTVHIELYDAHDGELVKQEFTEPILTTAQNENLEMFTITPPASGDDDTTFMNNILEPNVESVDFETVFSTISAANVFLSGDKVDDHQILSLAESMVHSPEADKDEDVPSDNNSTSSWDESTARSRKRKRSKKSKAQFHVSQRKPQNNPRIKTTS